MATIASLHQACAQARNSPNRGLSSSRHTSHATVHLFVDRKLHLFVDRKCCPQPCGRHCRARHQWSLMWPRRNPCASMCVVVPPSASARLSSAQPCCLNYASERYIITFRIANHPRLGSCDPDRNLLQLVRIVVTLPMTVPKSMQANVKANFNETVEVHVNLAAELRRTDLKLDGIATLPHDIGKAVKIAVFADGSAADEAKAAGADVVGGVELIEGVQNGNVKADFDICITTHHFVPRLQKLGKVLKGRMPSTKAGTVTEDVAKVVREAKRIVKFNKKDKAAVVHAGIGKVSFSEEALRENIGAFVNALLLAKPAGLKKSK
ncbi:ribosomal protein L1p/L10e family [Actinidia rufa]|uniref:CL1 n=1 Tax=Actinidia rufa TaxID=165716 RepID=A0A7J0GPQ5_9ERIC|nr:ribosomal protein L1p/L10e family [Actinidia rufa]